MENSTTSRSAPSDANEANGNGMPKQQTSETTADEARRQAMQRAEELADRLGEQVGQYVTRFGHNVLKWVARAREEAEDIWAEAQAIRERQRTANQQSEGSPPMNG
jgi:hypothetical protein